MSEFVAGNRIDLLRAGTEYFPALETACDAAAREIKSPIRPLGYQPVYNQLTDIGDRHLVAAA